MCEVAQPSARGYAPRVTLALLALVACSPIAVGGNPSDTDADADADADADTDSDADLDTGALHGTVPGEALPAPEFTARNRDGSDRHQADLLGHPTVMWYYPIAGTSG